MSEDSIKKFQKQQILTHTEEVFKKKNEAKVK